MEEVWILAALRSHKTKIGDEATHVGICCTLPYVFTILHSDTVVRLRWVVRKPSALVAFGEKKREALCQRNRLLYHTHREGESASVFDIIEVPTIKLLLSSYYCLATTIYLLLNVYR